MIPPIYEPGDIYMVVGHMDIEIYLPVPGSLAGWLLDWWHPSMIEDAERHGRAFSSRWRHYWHMTYGNLSPDQVRESVADAGPPVVPGAGGGLPGAVVKDAPSGGRADAGGITGVIDPVGAGVDNDRLSQQGQGVIEADALLPSTEGLGRSGHSMGGVIG